MRGGKAGFRGGQIAWQITANTLLSSSAYVISSSANGNFTAEGLAFSMFSGAVGGALGIGSWGNGLRSVALGFGLGSLDNALTMIGNYFRNRNQQTINPKKLIRSL